MPDGLQLVCRYRSADVGGDWYEWTPLDESEIAITIGDVAGHRLSAVATMSRLKAHMRAYDIEGRDPWLTLRLANRAFVEPGQMATVFDARYRRGHRLLTYASAGHPPPLVLRGRDAFFAELQPGPPIGFGVGAPKRALARSNRATPFCCAPMGCTSRRECRSTSHSRRFVNTQCASRTTRGASTGSLTRCCTTRSATPMTTRASSFFEPERDAVVGSIALNFPTDLTNAARIP